MMMCKTHFVIGTASALAAVQPRNLSGYLIALLGGTLGGLISDLDQPSSRVAKDIAWNRLTILLTLAAVLLTDRILGTGLWGSLIILAAVPEFLGAGIFLLMCFGMPLSAHRGFSHSLLALGLMTWAVGMVSGTLARAFFWGFVSHLVLDMLNKRGMRLLYPLRKGFCLGWCYADGRTAQVLTRAGSWFIGLYAALGVWNWLMSCFT